MDNPQKKEPFSVRIAKAYPSIALANCNDSYLLSYPAILRHFRNLSKLTEADFIVGAHIVYGWMPTVLTLDMHTLTAATRAAQVAKHSVRPLNQEEIQAIAGVVNNSLIGASKLLHFLCPKHYPIWDTRVARFFLAKDRVHHYQVNNIETYSRYVEACQGLIPTTDFGVLHDDLNEQLRKFVIYNNEPITRMRAAELIMFLATDEAGIGSGSASQ